MNNKFRRILSIVSALYCIISILFALFSAVRISPAFGFLGALNSAEKISLLKISAVISVTSAICSILLSSDENGQNSAVKMRFSTLVWICIASACPILGYALTFAVGISEASYVASALIAFSSSGALAGVLSDMVTSKRKLVGTIFSLLGVVFAVPLCIRCVMLSSNHPLLSIYIIYLPLPISLIFSFAAEMGYKNGVLTQKGRIAAYLCSSVIPFCSAAMFRLPFVAVIFKFSFLAFTVLYILFLILDLYKLSKRKDN